MKEKAKPKEKKKVMVIVQGRDGKITICKDGITKSYRSAKECVEDLIREELQAASEEATNESKSRN